jgi:hypothetical protein
MGQGRTPGASIGVRRTHTQLRYRAWANYIEAGLKGLKETAPTFDS